MQCVSNPDLGLLIYFLYYPGASWNGETDYFTGYDWKESPVYNQNIDGETKYGSSWGLLRRSHVSGGWGDGSLCGSRSMSCSHFSSSVRNYLSTRGCNKREYPGATWDGNTTYLDGYASWPEAPVYSEFVDGETKYGRSIGLPRRLFIGGTWYHDSNCGSRSILSYCFSSNVSSDIATRGCSDSL